MREDAKYVLYWAQMNRRVESNHGLAYAADLANQRGLSVLFYEGLTCTYKYSSDRLHTFLMDGVRDTSEQLKKLGIGYSFYLRRRRSDPDDMLYRLAKDAATVVTDDYPAFIAREHNARIPVKLSIPYYVVDSSCIVPMSQMEKREYGAYTIRPKIRKLLPKFLTPAPKIHVRRKFELRTPPIDTNVAECEIDHSVKPVLNVVGGSKEARRKLKRFLQKNLHRYANSKNEPSESTTSGLSPYLHFGHISSLEIALAVKEYADEHKIFADEFLEELIVRRELAFNFARFTGDVESFENLPDWAKKTLRKHARDKRDPSYSREQLERAETYDELWNAAQKELLLRGKIHGYYRMYWGKKIMEWTPKPEDALATMIYLNDRYALDGRDPNGYTNMLWCFGLHDRPWVERPIFGQVRYMSYSGMQRKTNVEAYVQSVEMDWKRQ